MPQQYSDLPEGAQVVSAPHSSDQSQFSDLPDGAQVVSTPQPTTWDKVKQGAVNAAHGVEAGAAETATGLSGLALHVPGMSYVSQKVGDALGLSGTTESGQHAAEQGSEDLKKDATQTFAGKVGYGGETLLEFLMGDEALKGLSWADKLSQSAKVAKWLENSPKLMDAIKMGANVGKAIGALGPEEQALIKKSPVLARLVGAGFDAIRTGAAQGAQTMAKTGGDIKQSAEDAAAMALTSGVIGGTTGTIGGMLTKAGESAKKVTELAGKAGSSASKKEVADTLAQKIEASKNALHEKYENGITDLKDRLEGTEVSAQDNPLADKAKELLAKPDPEEHPLVSQAKEAAGDRLDKKVRDLLTTASTGEIPDKAAEAEAKDAPKLLDQYGKELPADTEPKTKEAPPWKIDDLIQFRQTVRKLAESYEPGDVNARTLRRLLFDSFDKSSALDDTIEHLAEASGDDTAVSDYQALRSHYRSKINLYDDPVITKIREGKVTDAAKDFVGLNRVDSALPSAGKVRYNTEVLKGILGPQGMREFGQHVFGTMLQDSVENGAFNPSKFMKSWERITEESKNDLFDMKSAKNGLAELVKDAKSGANLQHLTRAGVLAGVGSAIGGHYSALGMGLGSLLGLTVAEGGGIARGRELLDYVAKHPAVWKAYQKVGNAVNSTTAQTAASAARNVVGTTVSNSSLRNALTSSDGLRGNDPKEAP